METVHRQRRLLNSEHLSGWEVPLNDRCERSRRTIAARFEVEELQVVGVELPRGLRKARVPLHRD
jgi:hypothetical protein